MKLHLDDLEKISNNPDEPSFSNTIEIFDRSGYHFTRVNDLFINLCASNCIPELQSIELALSGVLASHDNKIFTYPGKISAYIKLGMNFMILGLFKRIESVYSTRNTENLNSEQLRLVERFYIDFVRAGAKFDTSTQERYAEITKELAELSTRFTQVINYY